MATETSNIRDYEAACQELDGRQFFTRGLENTRLLLGLLGEPQRAVRTIQVVGTNGKGTASVAAMRAFGALGRRAGAYLSPHVRSYTERVMVGGEYISEEEFAGQMWKVINIADAAGVRASQFELLTVGAIDLFRERGVEWAVLEAGLGARYDATSAGESEMLVLTNVSLDHTAYLGESVEEISREKLAALRPGMKVLLGTEEEGVLRAAEAAAEEVAEAFAERAGAEPIEIEVFTGRLSALRLPAYQRGPAALGVRAVEVALGASVGGEVLHRVVDDLRLPGRFEVGEFRGLPVVLDGGHNPAGIRAALDSVRERFGEVPLVVVFGVLRDKDIRSMLDAVREEADGLLLVEVSGERAADPEWVLESFEAQDSSGRMGRVVPDVTEAVAVAADMISETVAEVETKAESDAVCGSSAGVVLVTGSLYTCARAWEVL